jgi:O-antigen/teichoic acid export membrane protein
VSIEHSPADILSTPEAGARVIRGGVLRGGGYLVGILLGAATSVFLLRGLSVDDFGRYATVAALLGIVAIVTDAGLTAVGAREMAVLPRGDRRTELLGTLLGLRIVLTIAGVAAAVAFAFVAGYGSTMVWGTLLAGAGILLINTQATSMMPLTVELRLGAVTAFEVLRQALTLVGIAVLAVAGATLLPYFAVQAVVGAVLLVLTPRVGGGVNGLRPRLARQDAARLLREALPLAVAIAMNVVYLRLLVIVVSLLESEQETGLYATSFRVFDMLIGIPGLVLAVALPVLAVAGQDDAERLRYGLQRMTEVAAVLSLGLALATFALAVPVIRLLGGPAYGGAASILQIQAWALVPLFIGQVAVLALIALRRQRVLALVNACALVLVLVLGLMLTPLFAGRGAAAAGVIAETALTVALLVVLARAERSVAPRFTFVWRPLVALAAGAAVFAIPGLGHVVQAAIVIAAFTLAAIAVRAVPYEVLEALRRRDPGSRGTT